MKVNNIFLRSIILGVMTVSLFSCEKEGDSYNISKETIFPVITITDEYTIVIQTGGSFTPAATAVEGDKTIEVKVDNTLDNTTPGVYPITYSATNAEGYSKSDVQHVIVYDPAIVPTDVSGNIHDVGRPSRTGVISLVEGTTNIFYCTDMGFGGEFPIYFQMDGDVMTVIPQDFIFGVTSVDGTYDPVAKTFTVLIHPQEFGYTFAY